MLDRREVAAKSKTHANTDFYLPMMRSQAKLACRLLYSDCEGGAAEEDSTSISYRDQIKPNN